MIKRIIHFLMTAIPFIAFSSCKKDLFYKKSNAEKLMYFNWQVLDVKILNNYSLLLPCDDDNILSFVSTDVAQLNRGKILCDSAEVPIFNGNWNIEPNDSTVNLFGYKYQLSAITEERMGMWLRNYITPQNDTFDLYLYYKAIPK